MREVSIVIISAPSLKPILVFLLTPFRTMKGWKPRRLGGGFGGKRESGQLRFGGISRPFQLPYDLQDIDMTVKRER